MRGRSAITAKAPRFSPRQRRLRLGAVWASMGNTDRLTAIHSDLQRENPTEPVIETKLFPLILLLLDSFLEICLGASVVWRLFGLDGGGSQRH